ncbi:YciI family protein [Nonomuraea dietziae]|uniref:YciI family protein n=1 Tax=Nonomuraea dietziae TaxID=65515 RepID=UPI0033CD5CAD
MADAVRLAVTGGLHVILIGAAALSVAAFTIAWLIRDPRCAPAPPTTPTHPPLPQPVIDRLDMQFFCYHRDRPGSAALREKLVEEHWSYMDRYAAQLIARGPTLDGDTATGSVHIVDLPDLAAARAFAFDEPSFQAGVYRDVMLRRWRNVLGRTMWDFPGGREGGNRYLVLGLGTGQAADLVPPSDRRDDLIAYGPLLSDDGVTWLGTAVLIRATDRDTARTVLAQDRYAGIEVHDWQFGGRR